MNSSNGRSKILIVDDSALNREILSSILDEKYDIVEAENGAEGLKLIKSMGVDLSLILLDIVMPVCDGFEVLEAMNRNGWIADIPVIMISSETGSNIVDRAYQLGVVDFIFRPFDAMIVDNRIKNTINLYSKQRRLSDLVTTQIYEKTRNSNMLISVLSHIVEFRNGESGMHVLHINTITEMLLRALIKRTDTYNITPADISVICTASSMHDIGKISIPGEVLNKPGRLTNEEFAIMKTHSMVGADMLESLPYSKDEPLIKYCYQICRWHHERYDGRGYPDGLKGEEIPISAQIVSIADVYDALTSERVYKPAYSHERAIEMIRGGECGTFSPMLLDCLGDISDELRETMKHDSLNDSVADDILALSDEISQNSDLSGSSRILRQFADVYQRHESFMALTNDMLFTYTISPATLELSVEGARFFGLSDTTLDSKQLEKLGSLIPKEEHEKIRQAVTATTPEKRDFKAVISLTRDGVTSDYEIPGRTAFSDDTEPVIIRVYGCIHKR